MTTRVSHRTRRRRSQKPLSQSLLCALLVVRLALERSSSGWGANGDDAQREDISSTFRHLSDGNGQHVRHFSLKHRKIDLTFRKEKEEGDGDYENERYDEDDFGDVAVSQKKRRRRRRRKGKRLRAARKKKSLRKRREEKKEKKRRRIQTKRTSTSTRTTDPWSG